MSALFKLFDAINEEKFSFVDKMTDEEVKEISPFVLLGWMHGAEENTNIHSIMTDTYCNPYVFSLAKHPRLLLKTFVFANGDIDYTRYSFVKPTNKGSSDKTAKNVALYYGCSLKDAGDYVTLLSEENIKHINEIMKETE